jgi:hypothetical protein
MAKRRGKAVMVVGGRLLRTAEVVDRAIGATLGEHAWRTKPSSLTHLIDPAYGVT